MSVSKNKKQEKEENVFSALLFRFVPYWPLFLILLVLCCFGAWVQLRLSTPLYQAYATILIKDEKRGVDDSRMLESLNIYTASKIVENEMEVIRSRAMMKGVVEKLRLYAPVYTMGRFNNGSAYKSSPVIIEAREPGSIKGYPANDVPLLYNKEKASVTAGDKTYPVNQWVSTPWGVLRFSENSNAKEANGASFYFSLMEPDLVAAGMVSRLSITPTNKIASVLNLTYEDEMPERAKDVLNELINVYARNSINEKNSMAANTLSFIDERLQYVIKDLDSIERAIQRYKSREGIVDLSDQGRNFLQNVSENDRQVGSINMQLAVLDQVERYVESKSGKAGIVPASLGINDPLLTKLLQNLYDAELQYDKLRKTMAENSPQVTAVATEIESIRPTILENVRNQRTSLLASRNNLASTTGVYSSVLKTIPQKERQLLEISRQHSIKNNVYSFLLQKREETALASSSTLADSRLIDSAIASYTPVSPKKQVAYMTAIAIAFILGIGFVCGKELLSGKILFRSDIEGFTQIPIAAEITSVKHKHELVVNQPDKVYLSEQFRHLRAAIGLYGRTVSKQKILVTSSISGEGKSFVASNLALSLALSGKKIVLIDADLRGPKTSSIFELEEKDGLAEFLQGKKAVSDIIYNSTSSNNLFVIPAGGICSGPTELLLNGRLHNLFAQLEELFDYILVDTSPIDPVTDAYVLSEYCDKTLFVIRHGYTPKTMVQLLDESNKIKALNNLNIVFNGIKKRGFFKGNYGFGYGFGYEYVYKDRESFKTKKRKLPFRN